MIATLRSFDETGVPILLLPIAAGLMGCAGTAIVYPPTSSHAGALRIAEVMFLVPGSELPEPYRRALHDSGIQDTAIQTGPPRGLPPPLSRI